MKSEVSSEWIWERNEKKTKSNEHRSKIRITCKWNEIKNRNACDVCPSLTYQQYHHSFCLLQQFEHRHWRKWENNRVIEEKW